MPQMEKMVGLEAEFVMFDENETPTIVPEYLGRDGVPLLGEIRGEPGKTPEDTMANFLKAYYSMIGRLPTGHTLKFVTCLEVDPKIFREAMKSVTKKEFSSTHNIYGTEIGDYSDYVVDAAGKITSVRLSCGLHVHFSCNVIDEEEVIERKYDPISLPLSIGNKVDLDLKLYKDMGFDRKKTLKASVSILTMPVVEHIVKKMDESFLALMPSVTELTTKYRRPGFYEFKPHGFEYRSLPMNEEVMGDIYPITKKAFELMNGLYHTDQDFCIW